MKVFKKLAISVLIVLTTFTFSMITVQELPTVSTVQAASIRLNKTKKTLYVGSTYKLKIKGTTKKVKWKSSNKKIATVNSKGKVTAKKKGTVKITAKVRNKKYTCKITVKKRKTAVTSRKSSVVYVTKTGKKYHRSGCRYLRSSKIKTTLSSAIARGYEACKICGGY